MNVARVAAMRAGLPSSIAAATVNRFCASGLQAVAMAAQQILHEGAEVALAGGVESITMTAQRPQDPNPWIVEHTTQLCTWSWESPPKWSHSVTNRSPSARRVSRSKVKCERLGAQQAGHFAEELAPMRVQRGLINKQTKQIDGQEEVCSSRTNAIAPTRRWPDWPPYRLSSIRPVAKVQSLQATHHKCPTVLRPAY